MSDINGIHRLRRALLCICMSLIMTAGACLPGCAVKAQAADDTYTGSAYDTQDQGGSREEITDTDGSGDQGGSLEEKVTAGSGEEAGSREETKGTDPSGTEKDPEDKEKAGDAEPAEVTVLSDYRSISRALTENEDDFASMTVDQSDGRIVKDGEEGSLASEYGAASREVKTAISSTSKMESFLEKKDGDTIYQVDKEKSGDYVVTAPYHSRRLIIKSLIKNDTLGAAHVYYNTKDKETILEFKSDEETKSAYERAAAAYGENNCFVDQIFYYEDIMCSAGTSSSSAGKCISWGNRYMGMNKLKREAPSMGYNKKIVVAVIDSGINRHNPLFSGGRILRSSWNFAYCNSNYSDDYGHGTHVAGIIADATPSNVKLLVLKVLNYKGQANLYAMMNALRYALECNAQIINMSMGAQLGKHQKVNFLNNDIAKAWKRNIPICCSAGNAGINAKHFYPANLSKTITVAAINSKGKRGWYKTHGRRFYFSCYGKKVDFAAPGTRILSAGWGSSYRKLTGTSMAAPHITAAIAYLKMMDPNMSVPKVKKQLKSVSRDLGSKGKDKYYGWGCPIVKNLFTTGSRPN